MNMINKLKLKNKLIAGFAIVLLLLVIISLTGYAALRTAANGFGDYREMARNNNLAGCLQANMLMVRMNVKDFIITGSGKNQKQYHDYYATMNTFLQTAKKEIRNPERAKKIDFIETAVKEYNRGFENVIEMKTRRNHIYDILGEKGKLMEQQLAAIMISAENNNDIKSVFPASLALRNFLLARIYIMKFMDTNKQKDADKVNAEFKEMDKYLKKLERTLQNSESRTLLQKVTKNNREYHDNFNDIVQLIFERNKIISGTLDRIGPEIAGAAEKVKLDIKKVQDDIGPRLQASNNQAIVIIILLSVLALASGIGIVFFITRNVLHQLGCDPSQIADVAKSIADGNLKIEFKAQGQKKIEGVYKDMEIMSKNLRKMFTDIASGTQTLTASSTELSAISEQITTNSEQTAEKSNSVATAAEEMATNMNSVAAATEQTAVNIQMIVSAADRKSVV